MNQHDDDTMILSVTARPWMGRPLQATKYDELFEQLSPAHNCIEGMVGKKQLDRVSTALAKWVKRRGINARVRTCSKHPTDGKACCWLQYDEPETGWKPATPATFEGAQPKGKKALKA